MQVRNTLKNLSKNYWKQVIAIVLLLVGMVQLAAYLITGNLILEWVSSFTPYFWILNLSLLFLLTGYFILYRKNITKIVKIVILTISPLVLAFVILSFQIIGFSYFQPRSELGVEQGSGENSQRLKVAFFNKLYTNRNIQEIGERIKELQPDIIGFAELTTADSHKLNRSKLNELYPYLFYASMQTKSAQNRSGVAVFSKYPLAEENTELDKYLPYLSVKVDLPNQDNDPEVIVIHTAAPITQGFLSIRNRQLEELNNYLQQRSDLRPLIIMGDFNLTPWSPSYRALLNNLTLTNAAQGEGIELTWRSKELLGAQIDQILHSSELKSENFTVDQNLGSDHHLI